MGGYILIVDDDAEVRTLISDALRIFGLQSHAVENGMDALRMVREDPPLAIVMDLMMPGMDGFTTIALLHRECGDHPIPIILLSGITDQVEHMERLPGVTAAMCKGNFSIVEFRKTLVRAGVLA